MSKNAMKYLLLPEFQNQQLDAKLSQRKKPLEFANPWDYPLAINSGAVDASRLHRNLLDMQVITSK